jgi:hypothetical protein
MAISSNIKDYPIATSTTLGIVKGGGDIVVSSDGELDVFSINGISVSDILMDIGHSFTSNGFQKLSDGFIIQWGVANANFNSSNVTVTFPIAFPTAVLSIVATIAGASGVINGGVGYPQVNVWTTTTFNIYGDYTNSTALNVPTSWIAVGN